MSIQNERQFEISTNGLSAWTPIEVGLSKVWIRVPSGVTVVPKATHKPDDANEIYPVVRNGEAISATSNDVFDVSGLAHVAFECSGISGTPVGVTFTSAEPNR